MLAREAVAIAQKYNADKATLAQTEEVLQRALERSQVRLALVGHTGTITNLAFSNDGKYILSADAYKEDTFRFWDAETGKPAAVISVTDACLCKVSFSPDGKTVAILTE